MSRHRRTEIRLRPIDPARDAESLHAVFGDPESSRYLSQPAAVDVAETEARLARWVSLAPQHDWAITTPDDDRAAGRVTVYEQSAGIWAVGVMLCPSARGCGLAVGAVAAAIDRVDAEAAPRRIVADIDPENRASIRLFERLGFAFEGVLRAQWETHLGVRDTYLMSLVADDPRPWRS